MAVTVRILGTGWDGRHPDLVFVSVEHAASRTGGVARADLDTVEALRIARGLLAAVQKVEEHRLELQEAS